MNIILQILLLSIPGFLADYLSSQEFDGSKAKLYAKTVSILFYIYVIFMLNALVLIVAGMGEDVFFVFKAELSTVFLFKYGLSSLFFALTTPSIFRLIWLIIQPLKKRLHG